MEYLGDIQGLLIDLAFFGGIILFFMSFFKRFRQHRNKFIVIGIVLVAIGVTFMDWAALGEAYQRGVEVGRGI